MVQRHRDWQDMRLLVTSGVSSIGSQLAEHAHVGVGINPD